MPDLTSSDVVTLTAILWGLGTIILLVALRYRYLLIKQELHAQEPPVCIQRWLPCETCGASTVPTALYNELDNPFRIQTLCTYCALRSGVEPFVLKSEQEEPTV